MKPLGRIGYEQYIEELLPYEEAQAANWMFIDQAAKDAWNAAAQAIVTEYEQRKPEPDEPPTVIT